MQPQWPSVIMCPTTDISEGHTANNAAVACISGSKTTIPKEQHGMRKGCQPDYSKSVLTVYIPVPLQINEANKQDFQPQQTGRWTV